jgi:hypothetical protein
MRTRDPYDSTSLAALLPDTHRIVVPDPDDHRQWYRVRARLKRYAPAVEGNDDEKPHPT